MSECTCPTFYGLQAVSVTCPVHGYTPAQAPADPGAFDLEAAKLELGLQQDDLPSSVLDLGFALIAAVEALRERVAELEAMIRTEQCLKL